MPAYLVVLVDRKTHIGEWLSVTPDFEQAKQLARISWDSKHDAHVCEIGPAVFVVNHRGIEQAAAGKNASTDLYLGSSSTEKSTKRSTLARRSAG